MSDHWPEPGQLKMVERLVHRRWDREFIEFNKQVILLVDAKLSGRSSQRRQIFGIQMKIAAGGKMNPIAKARLQIITYGADERKIKGVFAAGVRRGHNVRNAVGNRRLGHGERFLKSFC